MDIEALEKEKAKMITKRFVKLLKNIIHKIRFRIKLKRMDDWWYYTGGHHYGLFPPSFYYTHSEEEIKRITEETLARLRTMIAELGAGDGC